MLGDVLVGLAFIDAKNAGPEIDAVADIGVKFPSCRVPMLPYSSLVWF